MYQNLKEYALKEPSIEFLSDELKEKLAAANANPFIKIGTPDKSIPFITLMNGGVIADITANNPNTIAKNIRVLIPGEELVGGGAGFIDVHHGNRTLVFRRVESRLFSKQWLIDDVASALQNELALYYPGYLIQAPDDIKL
jgi:hypothetical protein